MDPSAFDALVKAHAPGKTRRLLLRLVGALPVAGSLLTLVARDEAQGQGNGAIVGGGGGRRRRRRNRHHPGDDKGQGKGKRRRKRVCAAVEEKPNAGKRKGCCAGLSKDVSGRCVAATPPDCVPEPVAETCAGKCASATNRCGGLVECEPCACATGCPDCQACNPATGACVQVTNGTACDDGNACTQTDICQNGVCVGSNPVVCPANACQNPGICDPATGRCSGATNKPDRTVCVGSGATTSVCANGVCCTGCSGSDGSCGACRVFATSTLHTGALGGLTGGDAICQARARAGNLPGAAMDGTYKAWLSTGTGLNESPANGRFRRSEMPYVLPVEVSTGLAHQVAGNWTDLTDGELDHPINVTELGAGVPPTPPSGTSAWSNTADDGTADSRNLDCSEWNDSSVLGRTGSVNATGATWTEFGSSPCGIGAERRLYCFQQA